MSNMTKNTASALCNAMMLPPVLLLLKMLYSSRSDTHISSCAFVMWLATNVVRLSVLQDGFDMSCELCQLNTDSHTDSHPVRRGGRAQRAFGVGALIK